MIKINLISPEDELEIEALINEPKYCEYRQKLNKCFGKTYTTTCPFRGELRHEWRKHNIEKEQEKFYNEYNLNGRSRKDEK
jgi:hypothetical protein